jgi:hypothetical protein
LLFFFLLGLDLGKGNKGAEKKYERFQEVFFLKLRRSFRIQILKTDNENHLVEFSFDDTM